MKHFAQQFEFSFMTWVVRPRQGDPVTSRSLNRQTVAITPQPARPRQEVPRPVHARDQLSLFSYGK